MPSKTHIALIGSLSDDPRCVGSLQDFTQYVRDLIGDETPFSAHYVDKLVFHLAPGKATLYDPAQGIDFSQASKIYIRGPKLRQLSAYVHYVSQLSQLLGVTCLNSYIPYYPGTKFAQHIIFYTLGIHFLETLYAVDKQLLISEAEKVLGYPYILKANDGSHGDSNYLVRSRADAERYLEQEPQTDFLAQAFCPNDRDYRILLVGDGVLTFERRGSADSHLNNTSKGGTATPANDVLPPSVIEASRQLARHLGLGIAGIDVMPHIETGELYFLEINSQPQFRTGALLEEKKALMRDVLLADDTRE